MKRWSVFFVPTLVILVFGLASYWGLSQNEIDFFILKGGTGEIGAYRLELSLGTGRFEVAALPLSEGQVRDGRDLLKRGDLAGLRVFSRSLGRWGGVLGIPGEEDSWPWYLGGGWAGLFYGGDGDVFSDLSWGDKIYLALHSQPPPAFPFGIVSNDSAPISVVPPRGTPVVPSPTLETARGPLRVEIQNGCGITNAADWVARQFKGQGLSVTVTGNAENFNYPKTVVQSSAGVPVALEDALGRLGLTQDRVTEAGDLAPGVDIRVVVGKDYPTLRKSARERRHH